MMDRRLRPVLSSKLCTPSVSHTAPRPRLVRSLERILEKKLALVIAGPGYGKTILAAQTLSGLEAQKVWISLDEDDREFQYFIRCLITSVRQAIPGFAEDLDKRLSIRDLSKKNKEAVLLDFLKEIEFRQKGHLIIALDDYHLIQDSRDISRSVEFLLNRMPATLHLLLIGRKNPGLKISRLQASDEVIEMSESQLAFDDEETKAVSMLVLGRAVDRKKAFEISKTTGGWPAATLLFLHARGLSGFPDDSAGSMNAAPSKDHIFRYLEENVFESQPIHIKEFMVRTSVLAILEPDFCDRIMKRRDSRAILERLSTSHLLTFPYGETSKHFRYHPLLREFLRNLLDRMLDEEERRILHGDVAAAMEQKGNVQGSLEHFLAAGQFDDICRILNVLTIQDLLPCPLPFLFKVLTNIPPEKLRKEAKILHLKARLLSLNGRSRQAVRGLQQALEKFQDQGDGPGMSACLKDLGFHHYLMGNIIAAREEMEALLKCPYADPFFPAEVHGYLILFSSILGRMEDADAYYEAAGELTEGGGEKDSVFVSAWLNLCYSNRFQHSGDFIQARLLNRKTLQAFQRLGLGVFLPLANFQASLTSYYLCRAQKGLNYAKTGLESAREHGIYDHQYAWLLYAKALNLLAKEAYNHALMNAREALWIFRNHDNLWGQASVWDLRAMIYQKTKSPKEADSSCRKGLGIVKNLGLVGTETSLALTLAQSLVDRGELEEARSILDEYEAMIQISSYHGFRSLLLYSVIQAGVGDKSGALESMAHCLDVARTHHFDPWLWKDFERTNSIIAECYARGLQSEFIEASLKSSQLEDLGRLRALPKSKGARLNSKIRSLIELIPENGPAPLEIQCLGPFRVKIGNREIPAGHWRNAKAAKIFKYLSLHGDGGFIPKDVLLELAWPHDDTRLTNNRFHVALNFLRKLLEPQLERGIPSAYIKRQNEGYRLEIGRSGSIDCLEFLNMMETGKQEEKQNARRALEIYMKAASLYGGPLLEEDLYEEWLANDRERISRSYLFVLSNIMRLQEEIKDWEQCVHYAEKYLAVDKYEESVYASLMRFHALLGHPLEVARTFERCTGALTDDLGLRLQKTTAALYRKLTRKTLT